MSIFDAEYWKIIEWKPNNKGNFQSFFEIGIENRNNP